MNNDLFNKLDNFISKKPVIKTPKLCCDDKENIIYTGEWWVCGECGKIVTTLEEQVEYGDNYSYVIKTFIPVSFKFRNLVRIHKWSNYNYYEIRDNDLVKFIEKLPIDDRETRNLSKIIFLQEFNKVRTRAKVKLGLICYSIYKSHLILKKSIDIDNLLLMLDINVNHYNSAVKKIEEDCLFYPKNLNEYLKKIDIDIDKNGIIRSYNTILSKKYGYNGKTILLSLIYLKVRDSITDKEFFSTFKISKNTIRNIVNKIEEEDIQLFL